MPRYVLTGPPGAGKTAILRELEIGGEAVVEEAATDVIALEHARGRPAAAEIPEFIEKIVALQRARQLRLAPAGCGRVFFDRSPVCTLALARYLGSPVPPALTAELDRVLRSGGYEQAVFLVRDQGFVTPTAARRISLADARAFGKLHEQAYAELGFELIEVPALPAGERAALVLAEVRRRERSGLPADPAGAAGVPRRRPGKSGTCRRWR
jgi:predicted ATPase